MTNYPLTIAALLLGLAVYVWSGGLVGRARGKYYVQAPATSGAPEFDRLFRAQMNTLEQIVLFVPLLVLAASLWGDRIAAAYGLVWSIGRILYVLTYAKDPAKRSLGFALSAGASMLVLIALVVTLVIQASS
jgi:glutathione S-transferase